MIIKVYFITYMFWWSGSIYHIYVLMIKVYLSHICSDDQGLFYHIYDPMIKVYFVNCMIQWSGSIYYIYVLMIKVYLLHICSDDQGSILSHICSDDQWSILSHICSEDQGSILSHICSDDQGSILSHIWSYDKGLFYQLCDPMIRVYLSHICSDNQGLSFMILRFYVDCPVCLTLIRDLYTNIPQHLILSAVSCFHPALSI